MRFSTAKNVVILRKNGSWAVEYEGPSGAYRLSMPIAGMDLFTPDDILRKMAKAILSGDFLGMPEKVEIVT